MNHETVEKIANAVLYEGYILYPYRPSSLKNRQRWNFGGLCPRSYAESRGGNELWRCQTQCLAVGSSDASVAIKIRFLHIVQRQIARLRRPVADLDDLEDADFECVDTLNIGSRLFQTWQEGVETSVDILGIDPTKQGEPALFEFHLPSSQRIEPLRNDSGEIVAAVIRRQNAMHFAARVAVEALQPSLFRLTLEIENRTEARANAMNNREDAMTYSLASTHAILSIRNGEFVSQLDPPAGYAHRAAECLNVGLYPVLAGDPGERATILASPVILYDYPQIAPESSGDLFDGAEIDEILTLRILALTDAEKNEMRHCDTRARQILDRIESDPEHLSRLHGTMRAASGHAR